MASKRRRFQRPLGQKRYKKLFIIAAEGNKTEIQYFNRLKTLESIPSIIYIECLKGGNKSSPHQVLKRMLRHLKNTPLKKSDEAWLVIDKDQWTDQQLAPLYEWSLKAENYGFALSNPKFEYWLLLHFEDGIRINSSQECSDRLARYLPKYDKDIDSQKINLESIITAIKHAKNRYNTLNNDWRCNVGATTVHKLVERILSLY